MKKLYYLLLIGLVAFTGCKKSEFDDEIGGEALGTFQSTLPANNAIVVLNSATPTSNIVVQWSASAPGVNIAPTYKFQVALKGGNFTTPYIELPSDNSGKDAKLTLTQKQLDDALKAKGIAEGIKTDLIWRVVANNGNVTVATDAKSISITRMGDGVSNFILYGPLSSGTAMEINPGSTADFINFKWQPATPGKTGSPVTYKIKFVAAGGDFNTPLFEITADNAGLDASAKVSYQKIDQLLSAAGFTDQSTATSLQWTVEATSGAFKKTADYVNNIAIIREVKLFIVGEATPAGWTPANAIQMIQDKNISGLYYIYVYLKKDGMKFLSENTDWNTPTQKIYGKGAADGILFQDAGSGNIEIPAAGYYRVSADLKNNKYYVQSMVMGAVGQATIAGWNPSAVFPDQALHLIATNKFLGLVQLTGGAEWKFIDGNNWGDGTAAGSKDFGKTKGKTDGSITQGDADNMLVTGATGLYRLIWNGTDVKSLKHSVTRGNMFLVGGATPGGWDNSPGNALLPELTYMGNGKWKVTTDLVAGEFKFIVEKGNWDYSYGPGATAGTITDGGGNMSVAASGNYTISIDEYNRTYTVVKN